MMKGVDEKIDEGVLRWFGHVERMEYMISKRVYVGECAGSQLLLDDDTFLHKWQLVDIDSNDCHIIEGVDDSFSGHPQRLIWKWSDSLSMQTAHLGPIPT